MNAEKFLKALERSLCVDDDEDLADILGVTKRTISNWRKGDKPLTERQVASALAKCHVSAKKHNIWPIVELYPINKTPQKNKEFRVIPSGKSAAEKFNQLKECLSGSSGIYVFYDSSGRALYVGKTAGDSMNLWKEINCAYNRKRGEEIQSIRLVKHPKINKEFSASYEYKRQIVNTPVKLHEVAFYFSAYEVDDHIIDDLETMLIRAFPNDLLNIKMENFEIHK